MKLTFRALIILSFLLSSLPGLASEPWQQWRIDASSDPDKWLETSQQWIETYDSQRDFSKLAMAYALRAEALRYSGNEDQVQSTIEEGLRFANIADDPVATALLRINQGWYFLQRGILNRAAASASYAVEAAKTSGNSNLFIEQDTRAVFMIQGTLPAHWKYWSHWKPNSVPICRACNLSFIV